MTPNLDEWNNAKDGLVLMVKELGFPEEFGMSIAKNLGSPKAIRRMTSYLMYERPKDMCIIIDEMLAIRLEIDSWRKKKEGQEAVSRYNEILRYGL